MKKHDLQILAEVKFFIDSNLDRNIHVKELCTQFGINRNKLQTGFKHLYNQTIHAYILKQRLQLAAEKLTVTNHPIKSIALDLGYTASNFHSKFKKKFGCSPDQFRTLMRVAKGI